MMTTRAPQRHIPSDARCPQATWAARLNTFLALLLLSFLLLMPTPLCAAEVLPPSPPQYFNDNAHVVTPAVAEQLNNELKDFERTTSNQLVVAIYPKMQSDSDLFDYTHRIAQSWGVGQKDKKNGVVLFAFIQDHKLFIQVGYGLEGALPDATCKSIIDQQITPRFKAGDYDGGFTNGVQAIMAATKGEYRGTGRTANDDRGNQGGQTLGGAIVWIIFFIFVLVIIISSKNSGSSGWGGFLAGMFLGSGGSGFGGGGGFSGGGGGGFSGGGGSFGGGGAGGSW